MPSAAAPLVASPVVFAAAFAVVSAVHTLVHDDSLGPAMLAVPRVMDRHRVTPSERVMIERPSVVIHDPQPAMVPKMMMMVSAGRDHDLAAAE